MLRVPLPVLVGGLLAATLPAQAAWNQVNPSTVPPARTGPAYASDGTGLVMFGGGANGSFFADTWRYDGIDWTDVSPSTSPSARYRHAAAWDLFRQRLVMFGGSLSGPVSTSQNDTWEWDGQQWTQSNPSNAPSARRWHAMAFDPITSRVLLFGGQDVSGILNDTWAWDGNDWTQLSPATVPPARERAAVATDLRTGRIVMFGGNPGGGTELGDTWTWNGSDWSRVQTPTIPYSTGTRNAGMVYDRLRDRMVLVGGITGGVFRNHTWEFDGQDWIDRGAAPFTQRTFPTIGYVASLQRTVLFGGFGGAGTYFNDTWEYQTNAPASFTTAASGCAGSTATPMLSSDDLPWLGQDFTFEVSAPGPNAQMFALIGSSSTTWAGGSLPFSLAALGFPQCDLLVSNELALPALNPVTLPLPTFPSLLGQSIHVQGLAVEPGFLLSVSNRGDLVLGAL